MQNPHYHSPPRADPDHIDQHVLLRGIGWDGYEAVLAMRGESSATRVTYREGILEFMRPSIDHETIKTQLARLLEAYAEERDIELEGYGSWTVKNLDGKKKERRAGRRGR